MYLSFHFCLLFIKNQVAATLVLAAALPMTVISIMNSVDETWTLMFNRSDEAGKELARSLLVNKGGHRPVSLVGYSFGARIIYSCLKELSKLQHHWEEFQKVKEEDSESSQSDQLTAPQAPKKRISFLSKQHQQQKQIGRAHV